MLNDKKYRNFLIIIAVLVCISFGLVAFNGLVLKNKPVEYKAYYRATRDVPSYSALTSDMFEPVAVREDVVLDGLVTNLADISGMYADGPISEGEYLTYSLMTSTDKDKDYIYTIEIQAAYVADIAYGDNVDIYSLNKDNSVTLMFSNKKLYRAKTAAIADATTEDGYQPTYESASKMYLKVTQAEAIKYYASLRDCKLIVLPYNEKAMSSLTMQDQERELATIAQAEQEVQQAQANTVDYTVQADETYEIIASNFDIDETELRNVNPDFPELAEGMVIKVPVRQ